MAPALVLLPSPLLGSSVWSPVAQVLGDQGWQTVVCDVPVPIRSGDDVLQGFLAQLPVDADLVLVPHSNAGAYVPELAHLARVSAAVFVDAILPPPAGETPLAPPELLGLLRGWADGDGLLPPWTEWWPEADVAALFPDASTRSQVQREQQRIALDYFEGVRTVPPGRCMDADSRRKDAGGASSPLDPASSIGRCRGACVFRSRGSGVGLVASAQCDGRPVSLR